MVSKQGLLLKRGPLQHFKWEPRFCKLESTVFSVFDGERLTLEVNIGTSSTVARFMEKSAPGHASKHRSRPFGFVVDRDPSGGKARTLYYFDAQSEAEQNEWVNALAEAIAEAKRGITADQRAVPKCSPKSLENLQVQKAAPKKHKPRAIKAPCRSSSNSTRSQHLHEAPMQTILEHAKKLHGSSVHDDVQLKHMASATKSKHANAWTCQAWLSNWLNPIVEEALIKPVKDEGVNMQQPFLRSLGKFGSEHLIHGLLCDGDVLRRIAEKLWDAVCELARGGVVTGAELNQKFISEGDGFTLSYGRRADFFNGLEALIGSPSPNIFDAMKWEHCESQDSGSQWTTGNYGVTTTPQIEWHFVVNPISGLGDLNMNEWPMETIHTQFARKPQSLDEFKAELNKINKMLEEAGEDKLTEYELIGARLYTGPMFEKYNAVNRGGALNTRQPDFLVSRFQKLCQGNRYVTTIHVINSCIVKLSKLCHAPKVYRGMSGGILPREFWEGDVDGTHGGVEHGFMSTTTQANVALQYALQGGAGTIMEIDMGMIDQGAELSWLSQYPHEKEICFAPLTCLQVIATRVMGRVLIVELRVNINLVDLTIDQVVCKRKKVVQDLCRDLSIKANHISPDMRENSDVSKALTWGLEELNVLTRLEPEQYNSDDNFAQVLSKVMCVHSQIMRTCSLWEDRDWGPAHPRTMALLEAIGTKYSELGEWSLALEMLTRALHVANTNEVGEDNPDTLRLSFKCGTAYRMLDDPFWDTFHLRAYNGRRSLMGECDNQTSEIYISLFHWRQHGESGQSVTAEDAGMMETLYERSKKINGAMHAMTLQAARCWAETFEDKYAAKELFHKTYHDSCIVNGPLHEDTLVLLRSVIRAMVDGTQEFIEALPLAEQCSDQSFCVYGKGHPYAIYAKLLWGACLQGLGRVVDAEAIFCECVEACKRFGPDVIITKKVQERLDNLRSGGAEALP